MYHVYLVMYKLYKYRSRKRRKGRAKNRSIRFYTGYTNNFERRMAEHVSGKGARVLRGVMICGYCIISSWRTRALAMNEEKRLKRLKAKERKTIYEEKSNAIQSFFDREDS